MSGSTITDGSESPPGISSWKIILIVFCLLSILGLVARCALWHHRQKKREEKEARKKASEGQPGSISPRRADMAGKGLVSKPELQGTPVGGVIHKMELDSTPVAELDSSRPVRELDGSGLAAQRGTTNRPSQPDPDPDAITPAPEIRPVGRWERWG
ncbi:hypothetical protein F5Y13DRAFT_150793 [Hypoxylon sp. FL1857]|nr:hypothetical protein F5Y13DRAFT_150793 [Hypoxylon sp. FL1857]